ncbi:MAG: O-methyltransferase [Clostridia bacterium]|nr:O-methyltransferase [Clostridia bacterium]
MSIEYDLNAIVPPYITEYLRDKMTHNDELLHELEKYAQENSVPIVEPETARFLSVMCRVRRPEKILEVGCAIGYSSILMANATDEACEIATLECDEDMVCLARENIKKAGYAGKISVIEADAKDYLSYIDDDEVFDMIFLDGPKAHYIYMLDECVRLLKKGGIIISDNVLYKGMTADDNHVVRRKITIVKRLRKYIDMLMEHPELETSLLPLGDGVTVSVKK